MLEYLKIVLLAVIAAVGYGIIHDMITAHVCVEYFSVAHPPIVKTESPIVYAMVWGVVATWWVGLPLGIILAYVLSAKLFEPTFPQLFNLFKLVKRQSLLSDVSSFVFYD